MKDVVEGLFSFKGRMPRGEAWLLLICMSFVTGGLLMAVSMITLLFVPGDNPALASLHGGLKALLQLAMLWPSLAILVKRGHDRNRPAVLTIGLWLLPLAIAVAARLADTPLLGLGVLAIWLYMFIDYGLIPGTRGANRYGLSTTGGVGPAYPKVDFGPAEPS